MTICIDCGRTHAMEESRYSRCPACQPAHRQRMNAKRGKAKSPEALARRAEHNAILRSPQWKRVAKMVKLRDGGCVRCGTTEDLTVHHTVPARRAANPFDPDLCVTLCRSCHGVVEAQARRRSSAST